MDVCAREGSTLAAHTLGGLLDRSLVVCALCGTVIILDNKRVSYYYCYVIIIKVYHYDTNVNENMLDGGF